MFRRLPHSLPRDLVAPATLEQLGYFVNNNDQIKMIRDPESSYLYRINRNDRVNEVYKEAMNGCIRQLVDERLKGLGLDTLRLPLGAEEEEKHVPIYVSKNINQKKRVVVLFGQRDRDLGIFSYRTIGGEGIAKGSAIDFVTSIVNVSSPDSQAESCGVILANPGQLLWYNGGGRAITWAEWATLPRPSAVHEQLRVDESRNTIPGNRDYVEHVEYVFENVLAGLVHPELKLDIIGLEYTGDTVMHYLSRNWTTWSNKVNGICLGTPQFNLHELLGPERGDLKFGQFVAKRTRAYFNSSKRLETPISGRKNLGCNAYASGEELYEEALLVRCWANMIKWFDMISDAPDYEEPTFEIIDTEASW